ncbi:hypothetical protein [Burkholderia contaminans]|uniref:hypothetical protein n=1 Tax=Burkholderia contaminans TaxID=488447 RepID=UPI003D679B5F
MPIVAFPTATNQPIIFQIGKLAASITLLDSQRDKVVDGVGAIYSLTIDGKVVVNSTDEHIRALIAALERESAFAHQDTLDDEEAVALQGEVEHRLDANGARLERRKAYGSQMSGNKYEWYFVRRDGNS